MKKLFRISLSILTIATLIGIQACQKEELNNEPLTLNEKKAPDLKTQSLNTFYSQTVPVGNGVARAWISESKDGYPLAVGINLSVSALDNLPDEMHQYVLPLPKNKGMNFYTHVLLDWNPYGHEPAGIYDLAHFDFHFYIIPNKERMGIPFSLAMDTPPDGQYIPPAYFQLPGLIPEMGAHWIDGTSPELPPVFATFTHTFIWGSYDGEFVFWEPMITRDYLLSQPDGTFPIPQPAAYQREGWYATDYQISYSENPAEYTIALVNLTHHN